MILVNNYFKLFNQVAEVIYHTNDDYSHMTKQEAMQRIRPLILAMSMEEIQQLILENPANGIDHHLDNQAHHHHDPIHFGWARLGHHTDLTAAH